MYRTIIKSLCGVGLLTLGSATGYAQDAGGDMPEAQPNYGLEDIIVTAQRRKEDLQTVPIAVSSISGDMAQVLGINEPESIAQIVPSLTLNRSAAAAVPFLRGIGTPSSTIGNEPSVATFIDDIYVSNGAAAFFEFNNIAQIEVLKGPQGTLFGRNATGGVVHVHTKDPEFVATGDMSVSYANYDTVGVQGYFNTPLGKTLAMNFSGYFKNQENGWGTNVNTGNTAYDAQGKGVRAKLLFENDGPVRILLNGNYEERQGSQGLGGRVIPGSFSRAGYDPEAAGAGFYDTTTTGDNFYDNSIRQISGKFEYDFGALSLISITSYTDLQSDGAYDIDTAPVDFFSAAIFQQGRTFTQELQLVSAPESSIQWLLGGFFLKDNATFDTVYSGQIFGAVGPGIVNAQQKTTSFSGFGQATAEIFANTKLTAGLRYTTDKRKFFGDTGVLGGAVMFPTVTDDERYSKLTWRLALDHQLADDILIYAAYNRGFKSGIFNLGGLSPGGTTANSADPEVLDAYSAGFKSEFFDSRLRLNVEGYYYDYQDIQVATLLVGTQVITNAGSAELYGVDIDLTAVPFPGLTINGAVSLEHGEYTSFPGGPQNAPLPPNAPIVLPAGCGAIPYPLPSGASPLAVLSCDLSGNDTVNTPTLATNIGFLYEFDGPIPIDIAASWTHKSAYFFEADNNPGVRQSPTDIINASVTLHSADRAFEARFWANNLTGEKYYTYITQSGTSGTKYSPAPPRSYGVTLSAHF